MVTASADEEAGFGVSGSARRAIARARLRSGVRLVASTAAASVAGAGPAGGVSGVAWGAGAPPVDCAAPTAWLAEAASLTAGEASAGAAPGAGAPGSGVPAAGSALRATDCTAETGSVSLSSNGTGSGALSFSGSAAFSSPALSAGAAARRRIGGRVRTLDRWRRLRGRLGRRSLLRRRVVARPGRGCGRIFGRVACEPPGVRPRRCGRRGRDRGNRCHGPCLLLRPKGLDRRGRRRFWRGRGLSAEDGIDNAPEDPGLGRRRGDRRRLGRLGSLDRLGGRAALELQGRSHRPLGSLPGNGHRDARRLGRHRRGAAP